MAARRAAFFLALLSLLRAPWAAAADTPAAQSTEPLPSVTIQARRHSEWQRARAFIDHVVVKKRDESYPIWHEALCLRVFGVERQQQDFIRTRLAQIITSAGARIAAPDCRANFHIIVTAHAAQLIQAWTTRNDGFAAAGWHAEKRRLEQPRAVRVWYGVDLMSADGMPLSSECPGVAVDEARFSCRAFATRIQFNEVAAFTSLVVIVDLGLAGDFSLGQLVDYIGLVGLTRLNLDADAPGVPTLLTLFRVPREDRLQGLSEWDTAFLAALYHTDPSAGAQDSDIARSMAATLIH